MKNSRKKSLKDFIQYNSRPGPNKIHRTSIMQSEVEKVKALLDDPYAKNNKTCEEVFQTGLRKELQSEVVAAMEIYSVGYALNSVHAGAHLAFNLSKSHSAAEKYRSQEIFNDEKMPFVIQQYTEQSLEEISKGNFRYGSLLANIVRASGKAPPEFSEQMMEAFTFSRLSIR